MAQSSTDVPYPAGAEGEAAVLLELVVQKDGVVSNARVVEGVEPFAEAARSAALAWRFVPARRGVVPVAARIRARVEFRREPEVAPPPASPGVGATPAAPLVPPEELAVEITVRGDRPEVGQTTLLKQEVRELPGAFGDAFRAIEALPGVAPVLSGMPYFFVRGAPPNNAGYFVDGVRVPLLFHLGIGQSVIHPGLIERVDFFPSAAPARYGGYAGAIIAGQTRAPATALHGEANLRLVDAGALLEAPFANGRGSALVAGRYGYPGPVLSLVSNDLKLGYWDYQTRASWKLNEHDTLSLFALGSHDYVATRSPSGDPEASKEFIEQLVSDFHRLDLRYDHHKADSRVRVALTGGLTSQGATPTYMTNRSLGARLEFEHRFSDAVRLRGGAEALLDHYRLRITRQRPREPEVPQSAHPPPTNLSASVYADLVWQIARGVELIPGVRMGLFASTRKHEAPSTGHSRTLLPAVDPRLAARVALSRNVAWLSALGLAHQYPSLRLGDIPAPVVSVPGFPFVNRQLQSAAQASQGIELSLPADLRLSLNAFYAAWWGLTDLSASCFQLELGNTGVPPPPGEHVPPYVCPNNKPVRGRAYGLELMLKRSFSARLSGWLSYTLSRSTRQARFLTPDGGEVVATVASEFDRTHVLNAVLGYQLGRGWRVGTRFLLYTGTPYSRRDGSLPVAPYNAYRNPAFYRLDFRLEKRWQLSQTSSIAFVLEGQNVTLRKEISGLGLECAGTTSVQGEMMTQCEQSKIGPLTIPSVGVEAFF